MKDPLYAGNLETLRLGMGYNTATHSPTSQVAQTSGQPDGVIVPSSTGSPPSQTDSAGISIVTSYDEVDVGASGSTQGSYNGGDYSVGASASFKNDFSFTDQTLNFLVFCEVAGSPQTIQGAALAGNAKQTLQANKLGDFSLYQTFGDAYVSMIQRSGFFYGRISMHFQTMQDKLQAQQSLSVSSVGVGKLNAETAESFTKIHQKYTLSVSVYTVGAKVTPTPTTVADMLNVATNFNQDIQDGGAIVDYDLTPITSLSDYEMNSPGAEDSVLKTLVDNGLQYMHMVDLFQDMVAHPSCYHLGDVTTTDLDQYLGQVRDSYLPTIQAAAELYTTPGSVQWPGAAETAETFLQTLPGGNLPAAYRTQLSASSTQLTFPTVVAFMPVANHVGTGDDDMDGHAAVVNVGVTYQLQSSSPGCAPDQIVATFTLDFKENQKDWTEFTGQWSGPVYTAPAGLYIVSQGAQPGGLSGLVVPSSVVGSHQYATLTANQSGATLATIDCLLDTKGPDAGKLFATNAVFNAVNIDLDHVENFKTS